MSKDKHNMIVMPKDDDEEKNILVEEISLDNKNF